MMLTRVRIEVEEETAEACVEALWKYEHAIVQQEVRRYRRLWPVMVSSDNPGGTPEEEEYPTPDQPWEDSVEKRWWFNGQLGRELTEEIIEFDEGVGYRGRRVVRFERIDTRHVTFSGPQIVVDAKTGTKE